LTPQSKNQNSDNPGIPFSTSRAQKRKARFLAGLLKNEPTEESIYSGHPLFMRRIYPQDLWTTKSPLGEPSGL